MVFSQPTIEIKNATLRLPPPGNTTTAMFAEIINTSEEDAQLLSITGDFAKNFELHEMDMSNGHMSMRKVEKILIKKKEMTALRSGGLHIMIFNLKKDLKENEQLEINLHFNNKLTLKTNAIVKKQ